MFHYMKLFFILMINLCAIKSGAVKVELDFFQNKILTTVDLPFPYYQRDEDDVFFFLHQNSYAVFNIEEDRNKVIVTGPLQPCIAIALTDGYKLLLFHVNPSNRLTQIKEIIDNTFGADKNKVIVRIYGLNAESAWDRLGWHASSQMNHLGFVKLIKSSVIDSGIDASHVKAFRWPLNNEKVCDGIYRHAQHNISIKMNNLLSDEPEKNINIFSISLVAENVLDFATETVNSQFLFGGKIPSFPIPYKNILPLTQASKCPREQSFRFLVKGFYNIFYRHSTEYLERFINGDFSALPFSSLDFIHQKTSGN